MNTRPLLGLRTIGRFAAHASLVVALGVVPIFTAHAEDPPAFLLKWGTGGFGDGQFDFATGIAVSTTGFVFAADASSDRIQKFTTDSVFVTKWGSTGSGPGEFDNAWDVTVDPDGNVYVADLLNNRIQKFDADGNFVKSWTGTGLLGADPSGGFIYVAIANLVRKFTTDGVLVTSWNYGPTVDSRLGGIGFGLDGIVYIAVEGEHSVARFTSNGALLGVWGGSFGTGENDFDSPRDVTVDPDGNVFVLDNRYVRKFTPGGTLLARWGSLVCGPAPGEFCSPHGIASDSDGNIYVMDTGNYRVQKFGEVSTHVVPTTWGRIKVLYR